jgi:DNA-binding CsgD family transcriptional regulator
MSYRNGTALAATPALTIDQDSCAGGGSRDQAVVRIAVHQDRRLVAERLRRVLAPYSDRAVVMHSSEAEEAEVVVALGSQDLLALLGSFDHQPSPPLTRTSVLAPREEEVVSLVAAGLTNHDIAARMFVTDTTLKSYIRSAYRKMGVRTRSQAVGWAFSHGLVPAEPVTR